MTVSLMASVRVSGLNLRMIAGVSLRWVARARGVRTGIAVAIGRVTVRIGHWLASGRMAHESVLSSSWLSGTGSRR